MASSVLRLALTAMVASASAGAATLGVLRLETGQAQALRAATAEARSNRSTADLSPSATDAVLKARDGHYWAEGTAVAARQRSAQIRFLVDTGATAVALTPQDAERLGVDLDKLQYGSNVVTAAGRTRAASVKLASLTVAGARVEHVDALVIDKGLDASLLGMSYLGRLTSFEGRGDTLLLRP